ncbi:hypothetical protein ABPG72_002402 [Tetrahymena utriculariae]
MNQKYPEFSEQQISNFLYNNGLIYQKKLGEGCFSIVVKAYSLQHQSNVAVKIFKNVEQDFIQEKNIQEKMKGELFILQIMSCIHDQNMNINAIVPQLQNYFLDGNTLYMSPEVFNGQKPYTIKADTFSIGIIILQALLKNQVLPTQIISLNSFSLDSVLPDLKSHEQYTFIQEIIIFLIDFNPKNRKEPVELTQKLKALYQIDQNCLKRLILPKLENFNSIQQINKQIIFSQQISLNSLLKVPSDIQNLKIKPMCQNTNKQLQEISLNQMVNKSKFEQNEIKQIDLQMYNELKHFINKKQVKLDYDKKTLTDQQISAIQKVLNECSELDEIKLQFNWCNLSDKQCRSLLHFLKLL